MKLRKLRKLSSTPIQIDRKLLNLNNRHFLLLDGIIFCLTPMLAMILRLDGKAEIISFALA